MNSILKIGLIVAVVGIVVVLVANTIVSSPEDLINNTISVDLDESENNVTKTENTSLKEENSEDLSPDQAESPHKRGYFVNEVSYSEPQSGQRQAMLTVWRNTSTEADTAAIEDKLTELGVKILSKFNSTKFEYPKGYTDNRSEESKSWEYVVYQIEFGNDFFAVASAARDASNAQTKLYSYPDRYDQRLRTVQKISPSSDESFVKTDEGLFKLNLVDGSMAPVYSTTERYHIRTPIYIRGEDLLIIFDNPDEKIVFIDTKSSEEISTLDMSDYFYDEEYSFRNGIVSPDQKSIAFSINRSDPPGKDARAFILDVGTMNTTLQFGLPSGRVQFPTVWTVDNKIVFGGSAPKGCAYWDNGGYFDLVSNQFVEEPLDMQNYGISPNGNAHAMLLDHSQGYYESGTMCQDRYGGTVQLVKDGNESNIIENPDLQIVDRFWLPDSSGILISTRDVEESGGGVTKYSDTNYLIYDLETEEFVDDIESVKSALDKQKGNLYTTYTRTREYKWSYEDGVLKDELEEEILLGDKKASYFPLDIDFIFDVEGSRIRPDKLWF